MNPEEVFNSVILFYGFSQYWENTARVIRIVSIISLWYLGTSFSDSFTSEHLGRQNSSHFQTYGKFVRVN